MKGEHQSRVAYLENMRLLCLCISVEVPWQFPEEETTTPREVNKFVCVLKIVFLILHCKFFSRRCATTTWKCLISRFVEDWNTKQQFSFSLPDFFLYNPLKFNFKEICQHLRIKRDGINAIKFDAPPNGIHFLSDVFEAVAVVVA